MVQTRRGSVGLLIDGWLIIRNYSRESNGTSEASCVGMERSVELDGAAGAAERRWLDGSIRLTSTVSSARGKNRLSSHEGSRRAKKKHRIFHNIRT